MKSLKEIKFNEAAFTDVDIEAVLMKKGIDYTIHNTKSGRWARMPCILPGHDDSNPSFFIHLDHGGWNCYVCGSGNWPELCERMSWDFYATETIQVGMVPQAIWKDCMRNLTQLNKNKSSVLETFHMPKGYKKITALDPACKLHMNYIKDRNISPLIDLFNFHYTKIADDDYGNMYCSRVIIPCHDSKGRYIWPEGRIINKDIKKKKYYRPDGVQKTRFLFNLHRVKRAQYDWVIVVEGIIDAMILWSWGYPAVCCFGAEISDNQLEELNAFNKVYICLDNDKAGIKGYLSVKERIIGTGLISYRIILPKKKDINDISLDLFKRLLSKAKLIQ